MAVSNQYIKDFLVNYWNNNGSLDGLSTKAPKIYALIQTRRRKDESTKSVNDYIYSALGVSPRGNLGEELTFEINNYIQMKQSLADVKNAPFYSKLERLAEKYGMTAEDMLIEADYMYYFDKPVANISYRNLNTYYALSSRVLKSMLEATPQIGMHLLGYISENGSLNYIEKNEANLFEKLSQLVHIPFGKSYTGDLTNADCIVTNKHAYFKESGYEMPNTSNQVAITKEIIYGALNGEAFKGSVIPPSLAFCLLDYLSVYRTPYNMYRLHPSLYNELKTIYLNEGCFSSFADMLKHEGIYYPELSTATIQYKPCQDENHALFISNQLDNFILMDRKTLAVVHSSDLEDKISIEKSEKGKNYVAVVTKQSKKNQVVPLHMFITGNIDTHYIDGNLLNVSTDNLHVPES